MQEEKSSAEGIDNYARLLELYNIENISESLFRKEKALAEKAFARRKGAS